MMIVKIHITDEEFYMIDPTVRRFKIHITDDCKIYDDKI